MLGTQKLGPSCGRPTPSAAFGPVPTGGWLQNVLRESWAGPNQRFGSRLTARPTPIWLTVTLTPSQTLPRPLWRLTQERIWVAETICTTPCCSRWPVLPSGYGLHGLVGLPVAPTYYIGSQLSSQGRRGGFGEDQVHHAQDQCAEQGWLVGSLTTWHWCSSLSGTRTHAVRNRFPQAAQHPVTQCHPRCPSPCESDGHIYIFPGNYPMKLDVDSRLMRNFTLMSDASLIEAVPAVPGQYVRVLRWYEPVSFSPRR